MFRCEVCNRSSKLYERPVMFTIETREKEYPERANFYGEDKHDPGGYGYEIVKEIRLHVGCLPSDEKAEDLLRERFMPKNADEFSSRMIVTASSLRSYNH